MSDKQILDVFGNPIYPGSVILISGGAASLETKILYRIQEGTRYGRKFVKFHLFNLDRRYNYHTKTYTEKGIGNFSKYHAQFNREGRVGNVVCVSNPLFNLDLCGMPDVFKIQEFAVEEGYLPKDYKVGNRITFKDGKARKGNAILYIEEEEVEQKE